MDITVLISTWNNAKRLRITLETLKECIIPPGVTWEVVLVNNNCTDDTEQVVRSFLPQLPLVYIKEPIQGLSRARNAGLSVARGSLIIFTDDDVRPCRDWIKIYWEAFLEDPSQHFWGGPIESEFEGCPPEEDLLSVAPASVKGLSYGTEKRILSDREYFVSVNWAAPLKIVKEAGGFDITKGLNPALKEISTGEETSLMDSVRSLGCSGVYLPDLKIRHWVPDDKCTMEHILERCEAGAREGCERYYFRLKPWVLLGRPVGLYVHVLVALARYLFKRLTFRKGTAEYINWRIVLNVTRGTQEKIRKLGSSHITGLSLSGAVK